MTVSSPSHFLSLSMSDLTERLNQLMEAMHQLQLENENLRESLWKLEVGTPMELEEKNNSPPASTNALPVEPGPSSTHSSTPLHLTTSMNPNVGIPDKFDGMRKHFRGFINQITLIIQLQPQRYIDDFRQVELHKPGLHRWSKLHHHFYIIFLPFWQCLRRHLGIQTDAELPLRNSINYIKVCIRYPFTPMNLDH